MEGALNISKCQLEKNKKFLKVVDWSNNPSLTHVLRMQPLAMIKKKFHCQSQAITKGLVNFSSYLPPLKRYSLT